MCKASIVEPATKLVKMKEKKIDSVDWKKKTEAEPVNSLNYGEPVKKNSISTRPRRSGEL